LTFLKKLQNSKPVNALKILCGIILYLVTTLPSRKAFVICVLSKYHEIFAASLETFKVSLDGALSKLI